AFLKSCMVVLVLMSTVLAGPVRADRVFVDGPPDVGNHSWCIARAFSHPGRAANIARNLQDQTVVSTVRHAPCKKGTDVRWVNGGTAGAYGMAECRLWRSTGRCDRYRITINNAIINDGPSPRAQSRKTY